MSVKSIVGLPAFDSQSARAHLNEALASPQSISPLPRVCGELAQLVAQQEPDVAQFARLIQSDPVLAGEIMRVANSPVLRPRTAIVSLHQAISWLGFAELRNIAMAVMLRGEAFVAPRHERETEQLWREAWLGALWAKEIAKARRKHVETAFLAALMHRTGAALALQVLSRFELAQQKTLEAHQFTELVVEFDSAFGRRLMSRWHLSSEVQDAASDWRVYRSSTHSDLAATVHAAHLLAEYTLYPELLDEQLVIQSEVFEHLGVFPGDRRAMLEKRDQVRSAAVM